MPKPKFFKIEESSLKGLIDYLSKQPYFQVKDGIAVLQNLEEIQDPPEPSEKEIV